MNGQYISTKTTPYSGNIYHTEGNIGIGTTNPDKSLTIYDLSRPSIRFETPCAKCMYGFFLWDLVSNKDTFMIKYSTTENTSVATKFFLDSAGRMALCTDNPYSSAVLQLESTDKGMLIPRLNTTQMNNILSPVNSLTIFNTDSNRFMYYIDGQWVTIPTKEEIIQRFLTKTEFYNTVASGITSEDTARWNEAYNWGNHAEAGYLTEETDPVFTAWDKDYNDLINRPDFSGWDTIAADDFDGFWSSLQGTPPGVSIFPNDAGYLTEADINILWLSDEHAVFLKDTNLFVGIGLTKPKSNLHIYSLYKSPIITLEYEFNSTLNGIQPPPPEIHGHIAWYIKNDYNLIFSCETFGNNKDNVLTLSANGNIGIGTDNPNSDLHIKKSFGKKPTIELQTQDADGYPMKWLIQQNQSQLLFKYSDDLKVSPILKIEKSLSSNSDKVVVNGQIQSSLLNTKSLIINNWDIKNNSSFLGFYYNNEQEPLLKIVPGNEPKIYFNGKELAKNLWNENENENNIFYTDGNVGIGTSTPLGKLHVKDGNFIVEDNVGIGTASPEAKLHIKDGSLLISGNSPSWTNAHWRETILLPLGSALVTTDTVYGGFKIGFGITTTGWYFIEGKDNGQLRYPAYLQTDGTFICSKVKVVELPQWHDDVFDPDYQLMPINELEQYLLQNKHLPDIPSEDSLKQTGLDLAEMQALQMKKIEELTLYIIQLNQRLTQLEYENKLLKQKLYLHNQIKK